MKRDGGEGGIRTLEGLQTLAGFQDQCIRPLCHLSGVRSCDGAFCAYWQQDSIYSGIEKQGLLAISPNYSERIVRTDADCPGLTQ